MNDDSRHTDINVRAPNYLIARTQGICPSCRAVSCRVGLLVPPQHEVLADIWECASRHAFLFYVESLSDEVVRRLQAIAPGYRSAVSPVTQGSYWANHCERCGAFQEDHDLFCEPEGAFLPVSPAAASRIEFLPVQSVLEAAAAGYAIDPEFVEFMAAT